MFLDAHAILGFSDCTPELARLLPPAVGMY